ncbi:MAG: hypothetical protein WBC70_01365 [Candidatus Aminicenantales bacterium]
MTPVKEYKAFRRAYRELNNKILEKCLKKDQLFGSASLLGIVRKGTLVFDHEEETDALMDFVLHEYQEKGKNAIALYREKIGGESARERAILNALLSSYTSLFRIDAVSPSESLTTLRDLLGEGQPVRLMDIGLSQCATPGFLLFVRPVPYKDMFITSGISFVFPPGVERNLLEKYGQLRGKTEPDRLPLERFVYFFRRNRADGLRVIYQ